MKRYYTHIWDLWELEWYKSHPKTTILVVPACDNRGNNHPILVQPEAMMDRGTRDDVMCPVCSKLNFQIRQGTRSPDIWAELAEAPRRNDGNT